MFGEKGRNRVLGAQRLSVVDSDAGGMSLHDGNT